VLPAARALRTVTVTRYVTPLREGGSLPAIVEADDDGMYVLKFRGSGHGALALVAELVAGELARALGLPVPDLVLASLDRELSRTEPDPEIHALIHDSAGVNVALDYLPGAVNFDPVVHRVSPVLASQIVWFDAFVSNVDRTARNTNMLMWHGKLWLIDHGSTLYFHHSPGWERDRARPQAPFERIRDHVLATQATRVRDEDAALTDRLGADVLDDVLALVPDDWLRGGGREQSPDAVRAAYSRYFLERLQPPRHFVQEANGVR
jgi:hypothetical protein